MTTQAPHLNSQVKNCQNCVHCKPDWMGETYDKCRKFQKFCETCVTYSHLCGPSLSGWRPIPPKPPRRSLRQWLIDTFWKVDL